MRRYLKTMMKLKPVFVAALFGAALTTAAQALPVNQLNPETPRQPLQSECGDSQPIDSLDKHVQIKTPPKAKRKLSTMLQKLADKTGIVLNPDDYDPSHLPKPKPKPCPVAPPAVSPAAPAPPAPVATKP